MYTPPPPLPLLFQRSECPKSCTATYLGTYFYIYSDAIKRPFTNLGPRRLHEPLRPRELRAQLHRPGVPREHDGGDAVLVGEAGHVLSEVGRRAHRDVAHDLDHQQPQEAVQDPREAVLAQGLTFGVRLFQKAGGGGSHQGLVSEKGKDNEWADVRTGTDRHKRCWLQPKASEESKEGGGVVRSEGKGACEGEYRRL